MKARAYARAMCFDEILEFESLAIEARTILRVAILYKPSPRQGEDGTPRYFRLLWEDMGTRDGL
jgi:hypothetical protein